MKKNIRFWISLSLCFLLLLVSIIFYSQHESSTQTYSQTLTDVGFDTPITFSATCTEDEYETYLEIVKSMYIENNERFDQYNAYENINNVYTINHEAYNNPIEIDSILLDCIQQGLKANERNSQFDITQGNILSLWHTYREEGITLNDQGESGHLPSSEEIETALTHAGSDLIKIDGNTIELLDPEVQIDLGGIAKGYTTQLVKEKLNQEGLTNGFINAGGNVVTLGDKEDGSNWVIGIQNPDDNEALLSVDIEGSKAIVTSGDYQRYYQVDDTNYSHIIDFTTGYPAKYCRSVTVICNDSTLADSLSTTLFCLSYEQGLALAQEYDIEVIWIFSKDQKPDTSATLEIDDFYIYSTNGIQNKIKES